MLRLNVRSLFILGALFFCLILSYYLFFASEPKTTMIDSHLVEESMSGVHVTRFDKTGHLNQVVTMSAWEHIKGQTVTTMEHPALKIYYPSGAICEISADKGEGFQANLKSPLEKLHLIDNVVVHQLGHAPNSWWELKTSSLLYFPSSETALTDDPVTVLGPGATIQAQGMRAYLKSHRVEFINQVKSHYAKST